MKEYIEKKALLDEICRDNCERVYDGKFYYCFGCKTQFAESKIQEARP